MNNSLILWEYLFWGFLFTVKIVAQTRPWRKGIKPKGWWIGALAIMLAWPVVVLDDL